MPNSKKPTPPLAHWRFLRPNSEFPTPLFLMSLAVLAVIAVGLGSWVWSMNRSTNVDPVALAAAIKGQFQTYASDHHDLQIKTSYQATAYRHQNGHYYAITGSGQVQVGQTDSTMLPAAKISQFNTDLARLAEDKMRSQGLTREADQEFNYQPQATQAAYGNGRVYCVFDPSSLQTYPIAISVVCYSSAELNAAVAQQQPFQTAFSDPKTIAAQPKFSHQDPSFALVAVGGVGSGTGAFAVMHQVDGRWQVLFGMQNDPDCNLVHADHVPVDLISHCRNYSQ